VPLFTGFMYAAIGSYIARAWRLFDFRFTYHPPLWALLLLAVGIYVNFFAHHYVWDARVLLFALTALLFGRCWVHFKVWRVHRRMPLLLGFALVALFIWLAENIGTFTAAWMYPNQRHGWELVTTAKLGAWFLLMIISYVLFALVNRPQAMPAAEAERADRAPALASGRRLWRDLAASAPLWTPAGGRWPWRCCVCASPLWLRVARHLSPCVVWLDALAARVRHLGHEIILRWPAL
jgi:hypothetical protein